MRGNIRKPLQQRSRDTANNVLNALDTLLREKDLANISIQELAHTSGASISSIYARFSDKHAMVLALHQKVSEDTLNLISKIKEMERESLSLQSLIKRSIAYYLAFARKHQHIFRAAILSNDALIYNRVVNQICFASELIYKTAVTYKELQQPDLEKKIDFALRVVVATLQQTWVMNTIAPTRFNLHDDELANELAEMACHYITRPSGDAVGHSR
ncbi:MAG: TetR/AcrR family transcriptional regulator [Proteobacteria bacterium]|nr:TetR/AcrR family transcriptional regulator [Pseudomonadota bacterium]